MKPTPSTVLKVLITLNPEDKAHKAFMDERIHNLKLQLIDHFPSLSDTQIRKINRISDDICACTIHVANYNMAKICNYINKLSQTHMLSSMRILELTQTEENPYA